MVGLALIPEALAFSIIAGVDPKVGLYASFIIAITTAFFGGRPGSISAATGAMALLMIDRVTIDLTHAHLWDQGAVAALDKVVNKFRRSGTEVKVVGLNEP